MRIVTRSDWSACGVIMFFKAHLFVELCIACIFADAWWFSLAPVQRPRRVIKGDNPF